MAFGSCCRIVSGELLEAEEALTAASLSESFDDDTLSSQLPDAELSLVVKATH